LQSGSSNNGSFNNLYGGEFFFSSQFSITHLFWKESGLGIRFGFSRIFFEMFINMNKNTKYVHNNKHFKVYLYLYLINPLVTKCCKSGSFNAFQFTFDNYNNILFYLFVISPTFSFDLVPFHQRKKITGIFYKPLVSKLLFSLSTTISEWKFFCLCVRQSHIWNSSHKHSLRAWDFEVSAVHLCRYWFHFLLIDG
jgi:hypothetical protein